MKKNNIILILLICTFLFYGQSAYSYEKIISTGTEGNEVIIKEDKKEEEKEPIQQTIIYNQNNYYNTQPQYGYKYIYRGFIPNQVLFGPMIGPPPPPPQTHPHHLHNNQNKMKPHFYNNHPHKIIQDKNTQHTNQNGNGRNINKSFSEYTIKTK